MKFPHFQTPSLFLREYFRNNPEHLKTYLDVGTTAAKFAIAPIGMVLKHLIEIQGMDPRTEPGRKMREAFQQALNNTFQKYHDHDFDQDFDFSWLNKKFEQTRKDIEGLNLTKEDFRKMTDVGNLRATQALDVDQQGTGMSFSNTTLRPDLQSGVPVTIDRTPVQELADLLGVKPVNPNASRKFFEEMIDEMPTKQARDVIDEDSWLKAYGDIHANPPRLELPKEKTGYKSGDINAVSLKDALKGLIEVAKSFESEEALEPTQLMARTEELRKLNKLLKEVQQPARPLKKKGKIQRVSTGKTEAVKRTPRSAPKATKKTLNRRVDDRLGNPEKEAEVIQDLIDKGHLDPKDFDMLMMEGLDPRSVQIWEATYGDKKPVASKDSKFKGSFRRVR